jgi:hypothetical protein
MCHMYESPIVKWMTMNTNSAGQIQPGPYDTQPDNNLPFPEQTCSFIQLLLAYTWVLHMHRQFLIERQNAQRKQ